MTRRVRACAVRLALGIGSLPSSAQAQAPRVYVQAPADQEDAAKRLRAELQNDGYEVRLMAPHGPSPCPEESAAGHVTGDDRASLAGIEIWFDADSQQLLARICYDASRATLDRTVLRAPAGDSRRLALAAVEALNGLRARPLLVAADDRAVPPEEPEPVPLGSSALSAAAVLVLQPAGGRPLVGTSMGLDATIHPGMSLELEVFVPVRQSEASGFQRELSIGAAWARVGPTAFWLVPPIRFGVSVHAGAALVWASARTEDPSLLGTTKLTRTALIAAGLWLESPHDSVLYVRAASHLSRLIPSVEVELGRGSAQVFGDLLLEMELGVGVRW